MRSYLSPRTKNISKKNLFTEDYQQDSPSSMMMRSDSSYLRNKAAAAAAMMPASSMMTNNPYDYLNDGITGYDNSNSNSNGYYNYNGGGQGGVGGGYPQQNTMTEQDIVNLSELNITEIHRKMMEIYEENNLLRVSLQAEINMRVKLEKRNGELSDKLAEAKQGLQETRSALTKLQTATEQMVTRRDERESQLQKVVSISKSYERRIAELESNAIKPEDVAKLNSMLSNTKLQLMEKEEAVNELEKQIMKFQHIINSSNVEKQQTHDEKHKLELKFNNTLQRVNELESIIETQREKINYLEKQELQLMNQLKEESLKLNYEKNRILDSALSQFQQERQYFEERIDQLEKSVTSRNHTHSNNHANNSSPSNGGNGIQPIVTNFNSPNPAAAAGNSNAISQKSTATGGFKSFQSPNGENNNSSNGMNINTLSYDAPGTLSTMGSISNMFPTRMNSMMGVTSQQPSFMMNSPDRNSSNTNHGNFNPSQSTDLSQMFPSLMNTNAQNSFLSPQQQPNIDQSFLNQLIALLAANNNNQAAIPLNNTNTSNTASSNPGNNNSGNKKSSGSDEYYEVTEAEAMNFKNSGISNGSTNAALNNLRGRVSFNIENNSFHEIDKDEASKDARRPMKSPKNRSGSDDSVSSATSSSSNKEKSSPREEEKPKSKSSSSTTPSESTPRSTRKTINSGSSRSSEDKDKDKDREREREKEKEREREREKEKERERRDREEIERREKEKREREEREERDRKERERREREDRDRQEKERKEKERERREKEENDRKERERRDREESERKERERREREEREREKEREKERQREREENERREREKQKEREEREREKEREKEPSDSSRKTRISKREGPPPPAEAIASLDNKPVRISRKTLSERKIDPETESPVKTESAPRATIVKQKSISSVPDDSAGGAGAGEANDPLSIQIRDLKLEINKAIATHRDYKQKIKKFNDNFEKEHNRQPNKQERKKLGKDIFKTYHKLSKEIKTKLKRLESLQKDGGGKDGASGRPSLFLAGVSSGKKGGGDDDDDSDDDDSDDD